MNRTIIYLLAMVILASANTQSKETAHQYHPPHVSQPRQKAPSFIATAVVPSGKFETITLEQYAGKYLVIIFYPFDFTYVCPTEIIAFSDAISQFRENNSEIIAISTDSHFTHLAWIKTPRKEGGVGHLQIPLLSDFSKTISSSYGVLVEDEKDELYGASLRGLFIVDGKGTIRTIQINDAPVGRSVEEALRLVKAFQHTDKFGEVCPANWQPGSKTIIPNQDDKIQYFSGVKA